jgi:hypothetical protein
MRPTSFTSRASLLAGVLALSGCVSSRLEEARVEKAKVQIATIKMAAELAYVKTGSYPGTLEAVEVSRRDDPWGQPFVYAVIGSSEVMVSSAGPDRLPATADDVTEGIRP